jgi:hypothetical protein
LAASADRQRGALRVTHNAHNAAGLIGHSPST